jgi:hypothetical protein
MKFGPTLFLVLAAGILALPHVARADLVSDVLRCTGDPCVVTFNAGGEIGAFKAAAAEARSSGRRVVINGPCLSACAIFADQARDSVCITRQARFGFHKGYVMREPVAGRPTKPVGRFIPKHSRDIASWVEKNGGFPNRGYNLMNASAAKRIWRSC